MEKRVLIFTNHFYPEYFKINDVVDWLSTENITTSVVTSNPNYPKGKIFKGFSVFGSKKTYKTATVYRLPVIPRGDGNKLILSLNYLSYFFSLFLFTFWLIITHRKYDTLLIHHTSPPLLFFPALMYKKIKGAKVILWDLDMWPQTLSSVGIIKSKWIINFLEDLFKWFYRQFDNILLGSESFKEFAQKRVNLNKTFYFPNWADLVFESQKPRERIYDSSKKVIISYAGNIGQAQDLESLIEAVKLSKSRNYEIRLIGDGRAKESINNLVLSEGLNDQIKFYDSVDSKSLLVLFDESDFLYLSLNESPLFAKTVPAKFQTYLASGVPIIGLISGETNRLIKENNLGYSCNAGEVNALSKVFESLSSIQDSQYQKMKSNCKELYQSRFSSSLRKKELQSLIINVNKY
ncbi:glycosyltransferase family 4 protein [Flavobacteriaceae bacterium]|nr:glycosyltransferase family 4 protein [Flavobacteriaceae bacterium]